MLIEPEAPWPPPGHGAPLKRAASWAAWWGGEPTQLRKHAAETAPGGYWATRTEADLNQVHLPLAGDIAHTSADLLAGDSPTLTWDQTATAGLWEEHAARIGWASTLLEAAETSSPLGGVYLRPQWDTRIGPWALPTIVRPDEAIPTFLFGHLVAVTFVRQLSESGEIIRWLEHHEPNQIRHELWKGSPDRIGRPLPLPEHPQTAGLTGVIDTSEIRPGQILVEWVPNLLPQPLSALHTLGRSDLQAVETLLDSLDYTWSSWMRDLDLGRGRLIVAAEYLDDPTQGRRAGAVPGRVSPMLRWRGGASTDGAGAGRQFDENARVFTPLPGMDPAQNAAAAGITIAQFEIRVEQHERTADALVEQIVQRAGRAPQTFGMQVDGQISGTATQLRERRSFRTRDRQRAYFTSPLERFAETMMRINSKVFQVGGEPGRPKLAWPDVDLSEPETVARTIGMLRSAKAASVETAVRMAHPEWEKDLVDAEVAKILAEDPVAPALSGFETPDQATTPAGPQITKDQADTFGTLVRSGADPEDSARRAGLGDLELTGGVPVTLRPPVATPEGEPTPP